MIHIVWPVAWVCFKCGTVPCGEFMKAFWSRYKMLSHWLDLFFASEFD